MRACVRKPLRGAFAASPVDECRWGGAVRGGYRIGGPCSRIWCSRARLSSPRGGDGDARAGQARGYRRARPRYRGESRVPRGPRADPCRGGRHDPGGREGGLHAVTCGFRGCIGVGAAVSAALGPCRFGRLSIVCASFPDPAVERTPRAAKPQLAGSRGGRRGRHPGKMHTIPQLCQSGQLGRSPTGPPRRCADPPWFPPPPSRRCAARAS